MSRVVEYVALAAAILTVAGCGDGDVAASVKSGWKGIDSRHYVVMDDLSLLKRWVDVDYNGALKKDVVDKGGVEAVLSSAGGKLEEKARKCFINMVMLNDALEGMGASRVVVTSVLDKASHDYKLKWEMSADDVVALLPAVAELYGILSGINAPPADIAEYLVTDFIDEPPAERMGAVKGFGDKAAKYRAVLDCLIDVGVPRGDAEDGLAQFVFLHGSGLPKDEFWKNEAAYSKINCEDLRQFVPEGRKYVDCVSAVKGMSGKEIAVGLVKFIAVPPDERAKALRGLHAYCGIFKELRGDLDDFAAALYAREVSEKIANGSDLMLAANWERIRNMSDAHKKAVHDLCIYVRESRGTLKVTSDQRVRFRSSADRVVRYAVFHEAVTSAGIPDDVAVSELAKFVFHQGKGNASERAYDGADVSCVKSRIPECRKIRKMLSSGRVPETRVARYLVAFLSSSSKDADKYVADCRMFVEMHGLLSEVVKETIAEAEDASTIFTDGHLDEELNEEIARRGLALKTCSVMDVRQMTGRDFVGEMRDGAAAQLWPEKLSAKGELPSALLFSGVLFRQGKMSEDVRVKGIEAAGKLAARIVGIQKQGVVDSLWDEEMKRKFLAAQWRIARIGRMRAEQERQQGLLEQARRSLAIAEELDECNSSLRELKDSMAAAREKAESKMPVRERMMAALRRADFEKACNDAKIVLESNADDPDANFAMGMWHFQHDRWSEAEKYLIRCKDGKPGEPAIWNNLAMLYMKMGKFEMAMKHARKAQSLNPASANIKDTLKQIEKAMAK